MLSPALRRWLFRAHLLLGLTFGIFILPLALTGILLSFEAQITQAADRRSLRAAPHPPQSEQRSLAAILAAHHCVVTNSPVTGITYFASTEDPLRVHYGRDHVHLVHPISGTCLGPGSPQLRQFFREVLSMHRWLGWSSLLKPDNQGSSHWKSVGAQITGASALGLLLLTCSGLVLWFPRRITRRVWRALCLPTWHKNGRTRAWNWHHVSGIWSAPILLLISATGVIMAYPHANRLFYAVFGESAPTRDGNKMKSREPSSQPHHSSSQNLWFHQLEGIPKFATTMMPGWVNLNIEPTQNSTTPETLCLTLTRAGRGRPDLRERFTLIPSRMEILQHEIFATLSPASRARQWVRWLHTGEAGGWFGQFCAASACIGTFILVWSGFSLLFRRWNSNRPKEPKSPNPN